MPIERPERRRSHGVASDASPERCRTGFEDLMVQPHAFHLVGQEPEPIELSSPLVDDARSRHAVGLHPDVEATSAAFEGLARRAVVPQEQGKAILVLVVGDLQPSRAVGRGHELDAGLPAIEDI